MLERPLWWVRATMVALVRSRLNRDTSNVMGEYSSGWSAYSEHLERCATLEDWLLIKGVEDRPDFYNVGGHFTHEVFNSYAFNRNKILEVLRRDFPQARSVTEYGCGLGRNLLFLKQHLPHLEMYGYELCPAGVALATAAARKFGCAVQYSALDYVNGTEENYIFPKTDVAITMFSLEQIPRSNRKAMENILNHSKQGSIHLEPVPENYPCTFRGILGRVNHWKADYLKDFEKTVSQLDLGQVWREVLDTSHNPLMFPTLYVFKKR